MNVRRTLRLARHEAAHAVVREWLGGRVAEVKILRRVNREGMLAYCRADRRAPITPLKFICISAAGNAEEHRARTTVLFSAGDVRSLKDVGLNSSDVLLADDLMQGWLRKPDIRRAVEAVARALVKRDLSGDDVRRIIKRAGKKGKKHG